MKRISLVLFALILLTAIPGLVLNAGAFPQYSAGGGATGNCADCHGAFASGPTPYISQHDGTAWRNPGTSANMNLHDGHRTYMLSSDCNTCHSGASRTPVILNVSNGGTGFTAIGCTGCHNGNGLRAHHVNSGASNCYSCHTAGAAPAENVKPPYYFTPDAVHPNKPTDPCNANGSESAVAPPSGLDNDGNLLYDSADPACTVVADTTAPTVTAFTIPATATSLTVSITTFTATDNVGVTGYMVTETATAPLASAAGWTATAPINHAFATAGLKTLFAWAKDAAGNVSASRSATVTITLPDTIAPTVTAFIIPATATSLTVSITTFTATDNVGVTGYMVTESATAPLSNAAGWTATAPINHAFATAGAKTLFAWAKDASGNVSASRSAAVTITLADTTAPVVTAFTIPATATSLTVSITTFTATDNVGVTGYMVTETATAPLSNAVGWSATAPINHIFTTAGTKTLYAWAKDAAGNVSTALVSASVMITMPGGPSVTINCATGTGQMKVETMTGGTSLADVVALNTNDASVNQTGMPSGMVFRDGLVGFRVTGVAAGGSASVRLTFPSAIPAGSKVYKVLPDGFHEFAGATISGNTITMSLVDGGAGDSDGIANGSITDPVGVALPAAVASGGGGGGGCSLGTYDKKDKGPADAVVFMAPLLVLAWMRMKKRLAKYFVSVK